MDRVSVEHAKIAVNAKDSVPSWPVPAGPPADAPNVLLIMLDDAGFADASTFGGVAETPALDGLVTRGLRYLRFHTAGICAPSRAALLSGRNQHRVGFGSFGGGGFPGYDGMWDRDAASIAEVLGRHRYHTAAFGKWQLTPGREISPFGPFDRWPTGRGFQYFFGNILGNGSQWEPLLWRNTVQLPPVTDGAHLTTMIADDAVTWLHTHETVAPEAPWFMYFAPEATHVPHQVAEEWIEPYRGRFDAGWDVVREETFTRQKRLGVIPADAELTPRPEGLPAWESLGPDERRLVARQMEVYAGYMAHTDHEVGRVVAAAQDGPRGDDTLILYIVGDNGTNEPRGGLHGSDNMSIHYVAGVDLAVHDQVERIDELGGPGQWNVYAAAWAWLGATPFRGVKEMPSHFGGTRNPLIVSWPRRIRDAGGTRSQFAYLTDIAATIYDAAGIDPPEVIDGVPQLSLDGVSLADTFAREDAPPVRTTQYFEWEGNRAIYHDGWVASAAHFVPWVLDDENGPSWPLGSRSDYTLDRWELYHVDRDFSQARDLAETEPEKLEQLRDLFDAEARRNDVYPLGGSSLRPDPAPVAPPRATTFHPDFPGLALVSGLPDFAGSYRITAELVAGPGASGVLLSRGGRTGGVVLYADDGVLVLETNRYEGRERQVLRSDRPIPAGEVTVEFRQEVPEPGAATVAIGRFVIDGAEAGSTTLTPVPAGILDSTVEVGRNGLSPVGEGYRGPFPFTGQIRRITVRSD
jgi:arylsulfatase